MAAARCVDDPRMFPEGGYEVDSSMEYYAWPTRLAIGTEDRIIQTVLQMVPTTYRAAKK